MYRFTYEKKVSFWKKAVSIVVYAEHLFIAEEKVIELFFVSPEKTDYSTYKHFKLVSIEEVIK